jgi:hypothetical protein
VGCVVFQSELKKKIKWRRRNFRQESSWRKLRFELLFSNGIIKNLFLNVNRQTEALTLILSRGVEMEKGQNFLKTPLTLVLSRKGGEKKIEKNLTAPSPLPSPAGWRGKKEREDERKNFKIPLTLSRGVERGERGGR